MIQNAAGNGQPLHHIAQQLRAHPTADWLWLQSTGPIRTTDPLTTLRIETRRSVGQLDVQATALTRWDGFVLDLFGCVVPMNNGPAWPQWVLTGDTYEIPIQIWRLKAYVPNAHAFAEVRWPTDVGISKSIHLVQGWEALKPKDQNKAVTGAVGAMRAIEGILKHAGGRKKTPREVKVDKLAEAGLKWYDANHTAGRYVSVEDCGRPELGEATNRGTKGVHDHMTRDPKVFNLDVHQRMHEMLEERKSAR